MTYKSVKQGLPRSFNSIKPNTDNTVSLTVAEYSDAIYE